MPTATADQGTTALPALIDRAVTALASARTAAEVLEARDMATVAYDVAKRAARLAKAKSAHDELIAKAHRSQADALEIEAAAKRRLADEYDAAQERGEVAGPGNPGGLKRSERERLEPTAADIGLSRKEIHEARIIRDAEKTDPGIVSRTVNEAVAAGQEPSKAMVRRAVLHTARPGLGDSKPKRGREAICARVQDAITILSGLPGAAEVASYFRGRDAAIIVGERLPQAVTWLMEFSDAWEEASNAEAAE